MSYHYIFGVLSVSLQLYSIGRYLIGIFKGQAKPHIFTWLIFSLIASVVFAAQLEEKAGAGMWVTGINIVACISIVLLALRYGTRNIVRSDWISLGIGLLSIPVWIITKNPLYSVIMVCGIDTVAFWPTIRKSWYRPREEVVQTFLLGGTAYLLAVPALEHFNLTTMLYPLWLGVINIMFVMMMLYRRRIVNL